MAKKRSAKKKLVPEKYRTLKCLCALTVIVVCGVVWWSSIQSGVRFVKSLYISFIATTLICATFWLVIKAVASYEERNGG